MNIVGLGHSACEITRNFENYQQYSTFFINSENRDYPTFLSVKKQNSHEDYEKKYKKVDLSRCKGKTTLIVNGSGDISGCALRILEQLKDNQVTVLYIRADEANVGPEAETKDRITLGVLQQYARSGLLERIYLVSNKKVEQVMEEISLKNYWQDINNIISSTYHMLNVFHNTEPLLKSLSEPGQTSRIATFGVASFNMEKEKLFYDLQYPRVKNYFFGVNEETLGEDRELLTRIRTFVSARSNEDTRSGFSIFSTNYAQNYIYSTHYASYTQQEK